MEWTKKQPNEQADELKKQPNRIFIDKKLAIKVIADKIYDCRTTSTHKFRPKLGYTLHTFIWYTLHYLGIRAIIRLAFWLIKLNRCPLHGAVNQRTVGSVFSHPNIFQLLNYLPMQISSLKTV